MQNDRLNLERLCNEEKMFTVIDGSSFDPDVIGGVRFFRTDRGNTVAIVWGRDDRGKISLISNIQRFWIDDGLDHKYEVSLVRMYSVNGDVSYHGGAGVLILGDD